eukprot:2614664-Rhodomonas_salina.1
MRQHLGEDGLHGVALVSLGHALNHLGVVGKLSACLLLAVGALRHLKQIPRALPGLPGIALGIKLRQSLARPLLLPCLLRREPIGYGIHLLACPLALCVAGVLQSRQLLLRRLKLRAHLRLVDGGEALLASVAAGCRGASCGRAAVALGFLRGEGVASANLK